MLGDFLGEELCACSDHPKAEVYGDLWLNPVQLFFILVKLLVQFG